MHAQINKNQISKINIEKYKNRFRDKFIWIFKQIKNKYRNRFINKYRINNIKKNQSNFRNIKFRENFIF